MKILIHSDEYYPTAQACSYRMRALVDAFLNQGDEVTVICSSTNLGNGQAEERRERILYSPAIRMKKKTAVMRLLNNLSFGISSVFTALKAGKADVVITTSPPPLVSIPGWMIARMKRASLIYDVRDIWPDVALEMGSFKEGSLYDKLFRFITRFMYRHADLITTVSPGKVEKIRQYVSGLEGKKSGPSHVKKVCYVGNGYDETVEKNEIDEKLVEEYHLKDTFTCVYIGNIGLAQGLDVLLKVARETRHREELQFLLFGMGAEKEMLEAKAREEGLSHVHFCGVLPHEQVYTILNYARLSFIPLKNANMKDSIPTKVYEALGIGCPVLLVAEGDSCQIVKECGYGECVSPDHTEDLVGMFDHMVEEYDTYLSQKECAHALMHEKYSRQKISARFAEKLARARKKI